jgi:hypothetical protein
MYIVPGSFDYQAKKKNVTKPWKCVLKPKEISTQIAELEEELNEIPYSFKRPISNKNIGNFIAQIQDSDRKAGFTISGVMKYVIDYTMEMKRINRQKRKAERIGVSAQRYQTKAKQPIN